MCQPPDWHQVPPFLLVRAPRGLTFIGWRPRLLPGWNVPWFDLDHEDSTQCRILMWRSIVAEGYKMPSFTPPSPITPSIFQVTTINKQTKRWAFPLYCPKNTCTQVICSKIAQRPTNERNKHQKVWSHQLGMLYLLLGSSVRISVPDTLHYIICTCDCFCKELMWKVYGQHAYLSKVHEHPPAWQLFDTPAV